MAWLAFPPNSIPSLSLILYNHSHYQLFLSLGKKEVWTYISSYSSPGCPTSPPLRKPVASRLKISIPLLHNPVDESNNGLYLFLIHS